MKKAFKTHSVKDGYTVPKIWGKAIPINSATTSSYKD